jgi:hypothetical protein
MDLHVFSRTLEDPLLEDHTPKFATVSGWCGLSGMSRTGTYDALGLGYLNAIKAGRRTLIDVDAGLAWLRSLPKATFRTPQTITPSLPETVTRGASIPEKSEGGKPPSVTREVGPTRARPPPPQGKFTACLSDQDGTEPDE